MSIAPTRALKRGLAVAATALAVTVLAAPAAFAAAPIPPNGTATATDPGTNVPLTGTQASNKIFTMNLAGAGSSCPGNTAVDGYKIYSFMVPDTVDPLSLDFTAGYYNAGTGLYDNNGAYYSFGGANTAASGQITNVPLNLDMSMMLAAGDVDVDGLVNNGHGGIWDAGILCTDGLGSPVRYWNQKLVFTSAPTAPNGFTWAPVGETVVPQDANRVALPLSAAALVAGGYFLSRRSKRKPATVA